VCQAGRDARGVFGDQVLAERLKKAKRSLPLTPSAVAGSTVQKTKRVKHEEVDTSRVGLSRDVCTCGGADELRPHSH